MFREQGEFSKAHDAIQLAITKFPNEPLLRIREASLLKVWGKLGDALQTYSQICEAFPTSIQARLEQTNVLKELGELDIALKRYGELSNDLARHFDVEISVAAILVAQGKYVEARQHLPSTAPRTKSEWVANHILGMILLKSGETEKAIDHFEAGLASLPYVGEIPYYTNALAVAQLRQRNFDDALNTIASSDSPITNVLRLHTYGSLNRTSEAEAAYSSLKNYCPKNVVALRDELAAQLNMSSDTPKYDPDWVFDKECDALALGVTLREAA